jgi:hypothetical protein
MVCISSVGKNALDVGSCDGVIVGDSAISFCTIRDAGQVTLVKLRCGTIFRPKVRIY